MKDRHVFDVSLVAGHRDYLGRRSDFSPAFVESLSHEARQVQAVLRTFVLTPPGRLHFTLRAVYGDRPVAFRSLTRLKDRQRRYAEVMRWAGKTGPRKVLWQRVVLTPNDVLILQGRAVGPWLTQLRQKIDRTSDSRPLFPASGFCHIVLGRPSRPLKSPERQWLHQWLRKRTTFKPVRMTLSHPVLVVTSNHFGTRYHPGSWAELNGKVPSPTEKSRGFSGTE